MLGGERQTALPTDISNYKPTVAQSFSAATQQTFAQGQQILDYVVPGLSTEEERKKNSEHLQYINEVLSDPRQGTLQQGANLVGNLIGSIIPSIPLGLALSTPVSYVAGAIGFGARQLALEAGSEALLKGYLTTQVPLKNLASSSLSHFLPKYSAAEIARLGVSEFAAYKGFTIPEHFAEHYNAIDNTLDTKKAIEDWGSDNYGFLLAGLPLAAGYVAYKGIRGTIALRKAKLASKEMDAELGRLLREHHETLSKNEANQMRVSELQDHLQQAEDEGRISPEMHEWYLDYLEKPNSPEVHEAGLKVLNQLQIPYDRMTGKVWHQVLSRDGVENFKNALFDQGITGFSETDSQLLSTYAIHNELDSYIQFMKEHPTMMDAVQGMTHDLGTKIEEHAALLKKLDAEIARSLPKGLLKKQIFTQNNIFQHLKKLGIHSIRDIPYHVPKEVSFKLKLAHQIKMIEGRSTPKYQKMYELKKHIELKKRLKSLKLPTPKEELADIQNKLMLEGRLISDYKNRKAYHRLEDLSQVWPEAKVLFDRIGLEQFNARQKGFNNVLKAFVEMVDNTAAPLAHPDSVKKYLHERIEQAVPYIGEFERFGISLSPIEDKVIEDAGEELLANQPLKDEIRETAFKEARDAFDMSELKLKQFRDNEKALKDLIECALGQQ
jgi:hypothetical protein